MICQKLMLSKNKPCFNEVDGVYQQIVFVRKSDLLSFDIDSNLEDKFIGLEPIAYHRINFKLKDGAKGFRFELSENSSLITASFNKSEKNKSPIYTHNISFGIHGVTERDKWILKQFDNDSDYFAVLQHKSNLIEVYGFENGFKTENYSYESSSVIDLTSEYPEKEPPYIYMSEIQGNEILDFDNNFGSISNLAEFNKSFNKDYNIK